MIRHVFQAAKREWEWILLDKKYIVLVLLGPICFALCIDAMYSPKKVLGLPVVFVDQDHSNLSRTMTRAVLANETFRLGGYVNSTADFPRLVAEDRARVCIVFPYGMERDLKAGRGGRVEVLLDQSNYLAARVAMSSATSIFAPFSVGANARIIEAMDGVKQSEALHRSMPIDVGTRILFNPAFTSNYLNFVAIGTAYIALQLASLVIAIRSGSSEFGERSFQPLSSLRETPFAFTAGKVLAYLAPLLPAFLFVVIMPHLFFGAPLVRTGLSFWLVLVWFPAALVAFAYGLSTVTRDPVLASEVCTVLTLPNFLLSGYTWPTIAFPKLLLAFKYALPMSSVAFILKKITLMGGTLADCGNQIWSLIAWTMIAIITAWVGTKRIIKHSDEAKEANA